MKKIFYLLIKIKIIFFLSIFQSKSDTFYYSGGCFWCTEQDFEEFRGVKEVISGFTGGTTPNPKYYPNQWGDHREAAKVIYDPNKVSFAELVKHVRKWYSFTVWVRILFAESLPATKGVKVCSHSIGGFAASIHGHVFLHPLFPPYSSPQIMHLRCGTYETRFAT